MEKIKAEELVRKFMPFVYCYMGSGMLSNDYDVKVATDNAKQCALEHCKELFFIFEQMEPDKGLSLSNYYATVVKEIYKIELLTLPK